MNIVHIVMLNVYGWIRKHKRDLKFRTTYMWFNRLEFFYLALEGASVLVHFRMLEIFSNNLIYKMKSFFFKRNIYIKYDNRSYYNIYYKKTFS